MVDAAAVHKAGSVSKATDDVVVNSAANTAPKDAAMVVAKAATKAVAVANAAPEVVAEAETEVVNTAVAFVVAKAMAVTILVDMAVTMPEASAVVGVNFVLVCIAMAVVEKLAKALFEAIDELDAATLAEAVADGAENFAAIASTTIGCL